MRKRAAFRKPNAPLRHSLQITLISLFALNAHTPLSPFLYSSRLNGSHLTRLLYSSAVTTMPLFPFLFFCSNSSLLTHRSFPVLFCSAAQNARVAQLREIVTERDLLSLLARGDNGSGTVDSTAARKRVHAARALHTQWTSACHVLLLVDSHAHAAEALGSLKSLLDPAAHPALVLTAQALADVVARAPPRKAPMGSVRALAVLAERVPALLCSVSHRILNAVVEHEPLLAWLRTFSSDHDFRAALEMALGKTQTECPFELWVDGRVDESLLSTLADIRRLLHPYLYRREERFGSVQDALVPLARLGTPPSNLEARLARLSALLQPLSDLIDPVGDPSTSQLMQLLIPARRARWLLDTAAAAGERVQLRFFLPDATGREHERTRQLAELEEFHASILLRTGRRSEQQAAATDKFVDMFAWVKVLHATLETLRDLGHPHYLAYRFEFELVVDAVNLQAEARALQQELTAWQDATHGLCDGHIVLNSFSGLQLQALLCALDVFYPDSSAKTNPNPTANPLAHGTALTSAVEALLATWNAPCAADGRHVCALVAALEAAWRDSSTPKAHAAVIAFAAATQHAALPAPHFPAHLQTVVQLTADAGRRAFCDVPRPPGAAVLERLARVLQVGLDATQTRPRMRALPPDVLPPVPLPPLASRVHNVCVDGFEAAAALCIVAFAAHGRMPEPRTCLVLCEGTTEADVAHFVARWAQSALLGLQDAQSDLHCLMAVDGSYRIHAAAATAIARWQAQATAPLLVLTGSEKQDYLASQLSYARSTVHPIALSDAQQCLQAMLNVWTAGATAFVSREAGAGKSFAIRHRARKDGRRYCYVPVSAATDLLVHTAAHFERAQLSSSDVVSGQSDTNEQGRGEPDRPALLHLDVDVLAEQARELDHMLFALVLLGHLPCGVAALGSSRAEQSAERASGNRESDADENDAAAASGTAHRNDTPAVHGHRAPLCWSEEHDTLAIEAASGPQLATVCMFRLLPQQAVAPLAVGFYSDCDNLVAGAVPGREAEAEQRASMLQRVAGVLAVADEDDFQRLRLPSAAPYWPAPDTDAPLPGEQCHSLLVTCCPEAAEDLSMWSIWNLVRVLDWQLSELFSAGGVLARAATASTREQLALDLLGLALTTAKGIALRQNVLIGATSQGMAAVSGVTGAVSHLGGTG